MSAQPASDLPALLQSNQLWHAQELLGSAALAVPGLSTGFEDLDAALPGRGWPVGQLNELICAHGGSSEWSLLQPATVAALAAAPGPRQKQLVLINPPYEPYAPAWQASGIAAQRVLRIDTHAQAQSQPRACWATEQALHCADVAVVVAWLPRAPVESLRRLQLAANTSQILLFVVRPLAAREQSSPAALRLQLTRIDALQCQIHVLKCRGSAAQMSLKIELLSPALRALLQARKRRWPAAAPPSITTQTSPVFRMTPRSQTIGLLPHRLLFGNERAAEGPAVSVKAHHGLDRTPPLVHPPPIQFAATVGISPERAIKRAARHARSR